MKIYTYVEMEWDGEKYVTTKTKTKDYDGEVHYMKGASPQTQTVSSEPPKWLTPSLQFGATEAERLYGSYSPEASQLQSQISSLESQIASAPKAGAVDEASVRQSLANRQYGTAEIEDMLPSAMEAARRTATASDTSGLQSQLSALQSQLAGIPNGGRELPQYYPESTVVPYAPETEQALEAMKARAIGGSQLVDAAQNQFLQTIQGGQTNPYLDQAIDTATRGVERNYLQNVLPSVDSTFSQAGRYGSGLAKNAKQMALESFANEIGDISSSMAYQGYGDERGRQLKAASLAPALAAEDYGDISKLATVGGAREALSGQQLQENISRYNYGQGIEDQLLDQYLQRLGILAPNAGTIQTSTGSVPSRNTAAGILGGAASGAGIASALGASSPWGIGLAAAGGLLGAF